MADSRYDLPPNANKSFPPAASQTVKGTPYRGPNAGSGVPAIQKDSAAYILKRGQDFHQPYLQIEGGKAFVWPLGVEGFDYRVEPVLGIHKYLGSSKVEVDVVHKGANRISMNGLFPGHTSIDNAQALRAVVEAESDRKLLFLPGVTSKIQYVQIENYSFSHPQDEFLQDVSYQIDFIRVGVGDKVDEPPLDPAKQNPLSSQEQRGGSGRIFRATASIASLRQIALEVYGNQDKWNVIASNNMNVMKSIPSFEWLSFRFPAGWPVNY